MNNLLFVFNTNDYEYICAFIKKGGLKSIACLNNFLLIKSIYNLTSEFFYFFHKKDIDKDNEYHCQHHEKYVIKNNDYITIDNFKDLFEHLSLFNSQFLEEHCYIDLNNKEKLIEYEIFQLFFN